MRKKINGYPVMTMGEVQRLFPVSRPTISKWVKEGGEVLLAALVDLRKADPISGRAQAWIRSPRRGPGSFRWVCSALNLDPQAVRKSLPNIR